MALCKRKPGAALQRIVSHFGLLKQNRSTLSSLINTPKLTASFSSPSSSWLSKFIGDPRADRVSRTPLSSPRRFESTVAEKLPQFANGVPDNLVKFDNWDEG
ncbi:uncharacterized protein J3R85_006092 [Psidium guajava]|nr:uncharacterized protein J3R85_006092 [Psidium guajava]